MSSTLSANIPIVVPTIPAAVAAPTGVTAAWGAWLAGFLGWAAPPLAANAAMVYRKLGPGLVQLAIPPEALQAIIMRAASEIEDLVSHDSLFIPMNPGLLSSTVQKLFDEFPAMLMWTETEASPVLKAELALLGAL